MEQIRYSINLRSSRSLLNFKKRILQFKRPSSNSVYNCDNPKGINLRSDFGWAWVIYIQFSHDLNSFQDSINPLYNCGYEVKSTVHFFLHYNLFTKERSTPFGSLRNLNSKLFENTDSTLTNILFFGKESQYN